MSQPVQRSDAHPHGTVHGSAQEVDERRRERGGRKSRNFWDDVDPRIPRFPVWTSSNPWMPPPTSDWVPMGEAADRVEMMTERLEMLDAWEKERAEAEGRKPRTHLSFDELDEEFREEREECEWEHGEQNEWLLYYQLKWEREKVEARARQRRTRRRRELRRRARLRRAQK